MPATALAGEIDGRGEITPIKDGVHASACAFSGLEDGEGLEGPVEPSGPGATQTPHSEAGHVLPPGIAATNPDYNCVGLAPGS
jgi:hypothetical protein